MNIEPSVIVSIVSATIAAVSVTIAAISTTVAIRNFRREQLNQKIQAAKWQKEYFIDLVKWSDESMILLSEALHLCDLDPQKCEKGKFFDIRHMLRIKLSAQIDKGRWFFPNIDTDRYGKHKVEAYRGYRHKVLDGLVYTYDSVTKLNYYDGSKNEEIRGSIENFKRQFTSEIQKILAPNSRNKEFKELTKLVTKV
ncbi:MAG: hypothetical protein H9535_08220 [Ignavibacteria bacterium]|nr:hypothetical protein [Ignavibacteria bacterium]